MAIRLGMLSAAMVYGRSEEGMTARKEIERAILNLPAAQPERKTGRWISEFNGRYTGGAYWFGCSECGKVVPDVRNGGWNFCPNCGADMRGKQDG